MSELGFYRFANSHPDEIAIVEPSEKIWTRGELLAKTNQLTHALREFGVKSGDVVAAGDDACRAVVDAVRADLAARPPL